MKPELIAFSIVSVVVVLFALWLPIFPLHYWVFGDNNLCDDLPEYKASKPSYCYLSGSDENYNYDLDTCADEYYNSWISNWHFVCATEQEAYDRCMRNMPEEYMIKDGDLYQRTIELNPEHVVCATRIMDGVPLDIDGWIKEHQAQQKIGDVKEE